MYALTQTKENEMSDVKTIPPSTVVIEGVTMPIGYRSVKEYLSVLKLNLSIAQKTPKYSHLIEQYVADIALVCSTGGVE